MRGASPLPIASSTIVSVSIIDIGTLVFSASAASTATHVARIGSAGWEGLGTDARLGPKGGGVIHKRVDVAQGNAGQGFTSDAHKVEASVDRVICRYVLGIGKVEEAEVDIKVKELLKPMARFTVGRLARGGESHGTTINLPGPFKAISA